MIDQWINVSQSINQSINQSTLLNKQSNSKASIGEVINKLFCPDQTVSLIQL